MRTLKTFFFLIILGLSAQFAAAQQTNPAPVAAEKTQTVKVKGVTCKNDLKSIADNVEKLKGVSLCNADKTGPTTTFKIKFDPSVITEKEIFAAIEATPGCEDPKDRPYKVKQ